MDAVLVNRFYLRGVEQIDKRTGEQPQKLPGIPARRARASAGAVADVADCPTVRRLSGRSA